MLPQNRARTQVRPLDGNNEKLRKREGEQHRVVSGALTPPYPSSGSG